MLSFERRARGLRGRPTCRLTFNSPPLALYSPALRMDAGKSGIAGGECRVTSMQVPCSFLLLRLLGLLVATANSPPPSFVYNESEELLSPGPYSAILS